MAGGSSRDVQAVKARESDHPDSSAAAQQAREIWAENGRLAGDLGGHHGSPISAVVPRQQVAGEAVSQGEQQQHHAHHPSGLAGFLVGAIEEDLDHVEHHHHDHHAGAPVMQAADQRGRR